uniref:Cysteine-rich secretory protein LCCL domain containing 1b n=1 Tax=Callorhinchus milii TaxID=7868 RepID=A0A4W3H2P7_CALMI
LVCKWSELGWTRLTALLLIAQTVVATTSPNATAELDKEEHQWTTRRAKRSITDSDRQVILDLHNKLRGQVSPRASNMEYMTWDVELERSSEAWASTCRWEHGPGYLLPSIGQNLGAHWGRYRPPTFHVQAWYDEVRDYVYPYSQECNPWCPFRCSGPVCTHYTQVVWATSNKIGCAINLCTNMNIWGQVWPRAIYLVCNYSPKGNWWGHAPYKYGRPCSACPPSYGGGCRENLCYKEDGAEKHFTPEPEEETNEVERQRTKARARTHQPTDSSRTDVTDMNEVINTEQMSQLLTCETKLRDRCKGTTCNRYECPAGCLESKAKVIGTLHYEMQSSVCRAGIHYGVLDNEGGWVDITRQGKKPFFIKNNRNGHNIHMSFTPHFNDPVLLSAFRIYCPKNCLQENPHLARVIGTHIYSDRSSICRTAVHAGIIRNHLGGYIDIMPIDKKKYYSGSYQNGIFSERSEQQTKSADLVGNQTYG